jgi:predicted  nucleic acid-binding Zn-ribbon protein
MKQYPDLGKDLAADSRMQRKLQGNISDLQRERNVLDKKHNANSKRHRELSKEIKNVTSRLAAVSGNSPLLQTRKRGFSSIDEGG